MVMGTEQPTEAARGNAVASTRRRARHQGQRGAAVFIVVLVISLLTAMGIFALRSASLADSAAGYDREGAQASLIAQYGITATAAYLGTGVGDTVMVAMRNPSQPGYIMPRCESNGIPMSAPAAVPPTPCYAVPQSALQNSFSFSSNGNIFAPTNNSSTKLGSTSSLNVNESTNAVFNVEFTDIAATGIPVAGNDAGTRVLYEVTLTSMAQVRPVDACIAAVPAAPNAAQSVVRSIITLGGPP